MTYQQAKRPRRQRKGDRLLCPDATANMIATDHAVAPFDRCARQMDIRWGIDRLPELVSPEMATRYGEAVAYLNECIAADDPAKTTAAVNNCIRGLNAMDAEATAAGQPQARGDVWQYALGDFVFGILQDDREWPKAKEHHPDLMLFTMREAALALKSYCETVPLAEVKKHFPKATISKLPEKLPADFFARGGDDIQFL